MKQHPKGFTFLEWIEVVVIIIALAVLIGFGYVAIHFIQKFW